MPPGGSVGGSSGTKLNPFGYARDSATGDCFSYGVWNYRGWAEDCTPNEIDGVQKAEEAQAAAATGTATKEQVKFLETQAFRKAERECNAQKSSPNCGDYVNRIIESPLYKDFSPSQQVRFWTGVNLGLDQKAVNARELEALVRITENYRCPRCSSGIAELYFVGGNIGGEGVLPPTPDIVGTFMNGVRIVGSNLGTFFGIAAGVIGTGLVAAGAVLTAPVSVPVIIGGIIAAGIIGTTIGIGVNGGFDGVFQAKTDATTAQVARLYAAFPIAVAGSPNPQDPCGPGSAYDAAKNGGGYRGQLNNARRLDNNSLTKTAKSNADQVIDHRAKLSDPSAAHSNWDNLSPDAQ